MVENHKWVSLKSSEAALAMYTMHLGIAMLNLREQKVATP